MNQPARATPIWASWTAEPHDIGERLDLILAYRYPIFSRRKWKANVLDGIVTVNGCVVAPDLRIGTGMDIAISGAIEREIDPPPFSPWPEAFDPAPVGGGFSLVYSAISWCAINKPAGFPTHPLKTGETRTAFNALIAFDPTIATAGTDRKEGGIVHRIDTETSGLLLAARSPAAFHALRSCFQNHGAVKMYLAIVQHLRPRGKAKTLTSQDGQRGPAPGTSIDVSFPIGHHKTDKRRMVAVRNPASTQDHNTYRGKPRPALTRFSVLAGYRFEGEEYSLVCATVFQAQMHQIRVHAAAIGMPLVGDIIYNPHATGRQDLMKRQALHAWRIEFVRPPFPADTDAPQNLEAALPADFVNALSKFDERNLENLLAQLKDLRYDT